MDNNVVAIVVTFNSSALAKNVVKYLSIQTHAVDRIIVVDNCSREEERQQLKLIESENVEFIWLDRNTGGAGGFCSGMKYAKEKYDPDWYWLMDDDAFPNADCLEKLLEQATQLKDIGCLAPLIYGIDLQQYQLYHHKKLSLFLDRDIPVVDNVDQLEPVTKIEADAFVGPLFSKIAVDTVGVADSELFIYGDDLEYTYRVSRLFNIYLIKNAIINHKDPPVFNKMLAPKAWWKDYYMFRNRLLFVTQYQTNWFHRQISKLVVLARVIKQILVAFGNKEYRGYRAIRLNLLWHAVIDGLVNKKGKTIDPGEYINRIAHKQYSRGYSYNQ